MTRTPVSNRSQHRRPTWLRWSLRILSGLLVLIIALAVAGAVWQTVATAADRQTFPPPGQLVDVGGRQIHLQVTGNDQGRPTVVLEAGMMSASFQWAWVQRDLAETTRVVSYDRAGLGWSDPRQGQFDPHEAVADLHLALERAGVPGPYVLVGHSMGGLFVRLFATTYPDDVVGLVLVDPSHPDQLTRMPAETVAEQQRFHMTLRALPWLSRVGGTRIYNLSTSLTADLPAAERQAAQAHFASTRYAEAIISEIDGWPTLDAAVRATNGLGDMPLVVLSASRVPPDQVAAAGFFPAIHALHGELAALSTRGVHRVVDDADHFSLVLHPSGAQATIAAVREVVSAGEL